MSRLKYPICQNLPATALIAEVLYRSRLSVSPTRKAEP